MHDDAPNAARPTIGITMGDPLGIGPEIVIKSLLDRPLRSAARFVIYGMNEVLTYAADQLELAPFWYRVQQDSERASRVIREDVVVLDYDEFDVPSDHRRGPTRVGGHVSKLFVEQAIADAMKGHDEPRHLDAIVTAPISKEAWKLAGFRWPGHTELLAQRTRAKRSVMAFHTPRFHVALATTHVPLARVRDILNIGAVHDAIELGHRALVDLTGKSPRIAVAGLNPHAGEGGLFGHEEQTVIGPAIEMARAGGLDATGPLPGDTVFRHALDGRYDLVVAMYHDQGLIPVKLLDWDRSVNWTLGLPIIRTSPDHGTAYDIAGGNRASALSMQSAIELAVRLASRRLQRIGTGSLER